MKHKILLVGSTGMLGSEVYNKFKDVFTLLPTACNNSNKNTLKLDITNFNNVNVHYIGRAPSASVATGLAKKHSAEQNEIINKVFL